jgi:hypothetical protein
MPKERFHLYLANEVLSRCAASPPYEIHSEPADPKSLTFFIGAISPDIFFYDLPFFSLSPLGNALHDLMDREGISIIYDWIAQTSSPSGNESSFGHRRARGQERNTLLQVDDAGKILWGLGFASHFLVDAAWHPVIDELSRSRFRTAGRKEPGAGSGKQEAFRLPLLAASYCSSEIECHRLLESELESFWLARSPAPEKYDDLLKEFRRDREWLSKIASHYRRFLEFAGLSPLAEPAPDSIRGHRDCADGRVGISPLKDAKVFEKRIVKCFLLQNFLLRLFANRILGGQRDRLLSLSPSRFLGALVTPVRPTLPASFSRIFPEDRNPFSERFLEQSLAYLKLHFCRLAERLLEFLPRQE